MQADITYDKQRYFLVLRGTQGESDVDASSENKPRQWHKHLIILYICIAFCTGLAQPVSANTVLSENSTKTVSELSFSEKLSNPCELVNASLLRRDNVAVENREENQQTLLSLMKAKASLFKDSAETILRTNVFQGCSNLSLPNVAIIPTAANMSKSTQLDVLRQFYTSLLNHTTHMYFTIEELKTHEQDTTCDRPYLSTLASDMRDLMCVLRLSTLTFEEGGEDDDSFDDSTNQILNAQLTDQPLCSRRSLMVCQTVGSTVALLRELSTYLSATVLFDDSATLVFGDTTVLFSIAP